MFIKTDFVNYNNWKDNNNNKFDLSNLLNIETSIDNMKYDDLLLLPYKYNNNKEDIINLLIFQIKEID